MSLTSPTYPTSPTSLTSRISPGRLLAGAPKSLSATEQMAALPLYAIPVLLDGQIRLRVYAGRDLKVDMPLRPRQALVLAGQLLNLALTADISAASADGRMLEPAGKQDVAQGDIPHG